MNVPNEQACGNGGNEKLPVRKKTTVYIYIQCIVSYPEWSDSHLNFKIHIHIQREVNSISYSHLLALRPSASSEGNMGRA